VSAASGGDQRPPRIFELGVTDRGLRLDQFVARALEVGRKRAQALCDAGEVRVDGRVGKKGQTLGDATLVEIRDLADESPEAEPELALDVRLERPDLVVVSKPAGMPTVPLAPGERGTLAAALLARYPEMRGIGYREREPGVIHRLDTLTSGLVVAARTERAFSALTEGLKSGAVTKRYLAVVASAGFADSGTIEEWLSVDASGRVRIAGIGESYAKHTLTKYRVVERGPELLLVELDVGAAFRHQIRVHLASLGYPIVGDASYGGDPDPRLPGRHALHASYVAWAGDAGASFAVSDEAPPEFRALLAGGRESSES
jgi:23S rRNA pseudouridine1911/1915/1917 synthase